MRRRAVRLFAVLAAAAAALVPAVPAQGDGVTTVTRTAVETQVAEAATAAGEVLQSTTTRYRVVTTTSCRRSRTGSRTCEQRQVRFALPAVESPDASTLSGGTSAYDFLATDASNRPAHWNRCSRLRYRVNTAALPAAARAAALAEVQTAMGKLRAAHGLHVEYAGATSVVPFAGTDWARRIPATEPAELYVAWASDATVSALAGSVAGVGGPSFSSSGGREPRILRGGATLDVAARVTPGFGLGATRGALLLHEIGHAANLGHVDDQAQVMFPSISARSRGDYQAGDRAGLRTLAAYPCF